MEPVVVVHLLITIVPNATNHAVVGQMGAHFIFGAYVKPGLIGHELSQNWPKWLGANVKLVDGEPSGQSRPLQWGGGSSCRSPGHQFGGLTAITLNMNDITAPCGKHAKAVTTLGFFHELLRAMGSVGNVLSCT